MTFQSKKIALSRRQIIGAVLAAVVVLLAVASYPHLIARRGPPPEQATPVQVATARRADVPVFVDAIGTVAANYSVTVTSRVDGVLEKVFFTEGQKVEKGQLLAQIDPRAYQATLKQYQGALEEHRALYAAAQTTLDRYRKLYAADSLAKQDLESQIATVGQYSGEMKTDQAEIDSARLNLEYARITAPISGYVGLRLTDPGNMVHSTDTTGIVTITQSQPIGVTFGIPEANLQDVLPRLRRGMALPADAYARDRSTLLAHGTVSFINNAIDTTTGTVKLKAMFANQDERLFPNQFVNVRIQTGTLHQALIVPSAAVQLGNAGNYVFVVNGNKTVSKKAVTVGPSSGDCVVISSGLSGGRVVTAGVDHLHEGSRVETVGQDGKAAK
jgi:multidrug efflux system membrane fusion protein